jgi:aryl-alcohol dehydrogenase-like predicted oxidoreductase
MRNRPFGRTGWQTSEIGFGTWGMGGWTGSDDGESLRAMERALALGCNFFDTAWVYGLGKSEQLLGRVLRSAKPAERVYVATKIPQKNMKWPAKAEYSVSDTYPPDHIREYTEKSLQNLGVGSIDLQQFHVWSDAWAGDEGWQRAVDDLKRDGLVGAVGISVNRREPANVLKALETGMIDSVQVVYNIFDQAPEDELFPYCQAHGIAVIARVPFDEGTLTGTLKLDSTWPDGDFRNLYFAGEKLRASVEHAERLRPDVPAGMTMPELALRFILSNDDVATVIPGMRKEAHVRANLGVSDGKGLDPELARRLRHHRWDRTVAR